MGLTQVNNSSFLGQSYHMGWNIIMLTKTLLSFVKLFLLSVSKS